MQISYKELIICLNYSQSKLAKEEANKTETQLGHKLKRAIKKTLLPAYEELKELQNDLAIEHCSVDEREHIIKDAAGQLVFTKENLRLKNKADKALINTQIQLDLDQELSEHYSKMLNLEI